MENEREIGAVDRAEVTVEANDTLPQAGELHAEDLFADGVAEPVMIDETVDYASFSKKDFVELLKGLLKTDDYKRIDVILKEVKPLFDEVREKAKSEALKKFKEEGGLETDFEFRADEFDIAFDANYKLLRDKRSAYYKSLEDQKSENFRKKGELLERFRALVDGEDSEHSFRTFKEIQNEWKNIGPVAAAQARPLWASYNALVDRFYDQRSIYFELKELDRKKNLEQKIELCNKAEKINTENLNNAVKELNELHHEFKHIGPVPLESKDAVWQRFKAASDAVYEKRDQFLSNLQTELKSNLEKKQAICEAVLPFATFASDKIKEWNQKTQEVLAIQKKWDAVGAIPRNKTKDINKSFWSSFKQFFHNKNVFFKKLDEERGKNLKLKLELIERAKQLQESNDWEKTAKELKDLQQQWKEVGPVPEKQREKVFQEFKTACDYFFEHRRTQLEQVDKDQEETLAKKEAIIEEMIQLAQSGNGSRELLHNLQNQFNSLGFVPKRAINSIKDRFNEASQKLLSSLQGLSEDEKAEMTLEVQMNGFRNDPNGERKLFHKEQSIRKQISKVENDIAVLRNNLEFFGRSKNADKFKEEFNEKINVATEHLNQLKKQLKILKTA